MKKGRFKVTQEYLHICSELCVCVCVCACACVCVRACVSYMIQCMLASFERTKTQLQRIGVPACLEWWPPHKESGTTPGCRSQGCQWSTFREDRKPGLAVAQTGRQV